MIWPKLDVILFITGMASQKLISGESSWNQSLAQTIITLYVGI